MNTSTGINIQSFTDEQLREALGSLVDARNAGITSETLQIAVCAIVSTLATPQADRRWDTPKVSA